MTNQGDYSTERIEKLKEEWHLAGFRIEQIAEFVDKTRRFQYRSRLKMNEKPLRKYENALYSLFFDINLYVQARDHDYTSYGPEGIEEHKDVLDLFNEVDKHIKHKEFEKAFNKLLKIDTTTNTARIKEGFDIPKQTERFNPNKISTEKQHKH